MPAMLSCSRQRLTSRHHSGAVQRHYERDLIEQGHSQQGQLNAPIFGKRRDARQTARLAAIRIGYSAPKE
jgi:hypothetical protein